MHPMPNLNIFMINDTCDPAMFGVNQQDAPDKFYRKSINLSNPFYVKL